MKPCPSCRKLGMYDWSPNSIETARARQMCGFVEEKALLLASGDTAAITVPGVGGPR